MGVTLSVFSPAISKGAGTLGPNKSRSYGRTPALYFIPSWVLSRGCAAAMNRHR